jgi:hypothetical protein
MHKSRLFAPSATSFLCARGSLLVVPALMLCFSLLLLAPPAQGASTHECAPDTPSPLPVTPVVPQAKAGIIQINEVLSNPASAWNCSDTTGTVSPTANSWVELYNPQSEPFNLYPTHTQISLDNGANWYQLPFGTSIAANGFLVLFPEEKVPTPSAWDILLTMGNTLIDALQPPALLPDQSYARIPNGATTWSISDQPTIGASNAAASQATPSAMVPTPKSTPTGQPVPPGNSPGDGSVNNAPGVGTQPVWGSVQLPAGATPSPTPGAQDTAASSAPLLSQQLQSQPQNSGLTGWHIAGICALALLLLASLVYCWRLFHAP